MITAGIARKRRTDQALFQDLGLAEQLVDESSRDLLALAQECDQALARKCGSASGFDGIQARQGSAELRAKRRLRSPNPS